MTDLATPISGNRPKITQRFYAWVEDKRPYFIVFGLMLVLFLAFLFPRIVITIGSGEGGVLYKRLFNGTITDYVFPEGLYLIWPWDTMYIYNARVQLVRHEFDVLTNKGLPIHLRIAIRFRPEYELLGVLHQQLGPDYVEKVIIPQIESVLRKNIGQYDPEDIYTNKEGILSRILLLALEEAGRKYVHMDEVVIRSLELPESVRKAIEEKLVYEQQYKSYVFRLAKEKEEAKRKRIEAQGIADYQEIISQNLNEQLITWHGIQATVDLATSHNAKVVVIGSGKGGLPLILGGDVFKGESLKKELIDEGLPSESNTTPKSRLNNERLQQEPRRDPFEK